MLHRMIRPRLLFRLSGLLLVTVPVTTCRSAAAVILDLPEPTPVSAAATPAETDKPRSTTASGTMFLAAPEDTVRPEIEEIRTADSILARLPRHASGDVDWVAAIRQRIIKPRDQLPGGEPTGRQSFDYDFYYGEVDTFFPHSSHTDWLSCGNCHPGVFRGPGSSRTSMKEIGEGKTCGACHGKMAFGVPVCERCHQSVGLPPDRIDAALAVDIVIPRDTAVGMTGEFDPSLFPHWRHRIQYKCSTCHDELFVPKVGANAITMQQIQAGKSCGTCHDDVTAFGALQCARCHAPVPDPVRLPDPDSVQAPPADSG